VSSEAKARKELIDPLLRRAGWRVGDPSHVSEELHLEAPPDPSGAGRTAESGPPQRAKGLEADYALLNRGRVLAIVEAKRPSSDPRIADEQALTYLRAVQARQGGLPPFHIVTNGHVTRFWESDFYPPVDVHGFPTPDELDWMDQRREQRRPLSVELIDTAIAGRDYQIQAIRAILESIEKRRRNFLLVMATGTGKTRTAMALIDVLQRAHWVRRVLFLVDRVALRDQAIEAFKDHLPDSPYWPRVEGDDVESDWAANRRLYCTTYPTMLNLIEAGTTPETFISPHFFDLVILDESHRSIYNKFGAVLDWFSCLKLGLTATPRDHVEHDTFKLFDCPTGDPTFAYSFEEAVAHVPPYLCDFEVLKVRTRFQLEGIKGGALGDDVRRSLIAQGKDPDDLDFEGTDIERTVTNSGTNAVVVKEFMAECIKDPTGTLPGKSIFFAMGQAHARRLAEIFDALYPEHAGNLARVVVSEDRFVHGKGGLIDQFRRQDFPRIAISIDMLDTGIDIPEVVNLVFAKPVFSYTKFWQMIGRGTRVLPAPPNRKPWCPEKDRFLIIDCWGNFEYWKMNPKGKEPGANVPLPVRLFRARLDQLEAAIAAGRPDAAATATHGLRSDLAALPTGNAIVLSHSAELERTKSPGFWDAPAAVDLGLLRTTIAPLLRARTGVEPKAMRLETEIAELSTARLAGDVDAITLLTESIVEQVTELPLTVNVVAAEKSVIESARDVSWWTNAPYDALAGAAARLAPLMRYRTRPSEAMTKLHLEDQTVIKGPVEFGAGHERLTTSAWRERIEASVRELVGANPVMKRLAAGRELTESELADLADILRRQDPEITEDSLRRAYDVRSASLVPLLRHVLGLELIPSWPEAVTRAFDDFVTRHDTMSELQIRFLQTLKTFLLQKRRIDRGDLVDAPFTQLHPKGIRGVFAGPELAEVLDLAEGLVA
jgi:type I restriction enzyme R subunit